MSTWRSLVLEQFPEFGHAPESWELGEVGSHLGSLLRRAARDGNQRVGARVLSFVLWAEGQCKNDERFAHLCHDALRDTVDSPSSRSFLASLLNGRSLVQLRGFILYVASKEVLAEVAQSPRGLTLRST